MAGPTIALIAGEASGDMLGADLIRQLRVRYPEARFVGVGGPQMAAEGMNIWVDCEELAVMGLVEVLRHLPRLLRLRKQLRQRLLDLRPHLFIGIDAPDFNLGLERRLREAGIPTVHYVSPSIWAWRQSRAARIGQCADTVLCLLPFEPALYQAHGVDARFVGHPLADAMPLSPDREQARRQLGLSSDGLYLAMLPGSRGSEIQRLAIPFLDAAVKLRQQTPALKVIVPLANPRCRLRFEAIKAVHAPGLELTLVDGQAGLVMTAADAILVASGTAALEAMLCHRPMVVGYRIAPVSHLIVRLLRLLRTPWVSLPNALAGRFIVPELLQQHCNGEQLASALRPLLDPTSSAGAAQISEFARLHCSLKRDAGVQPAEVISEILAAKQVSAST